MAEKVVIELVIDGRGVELGAQVTQRAMENIQSAAQRIFDSFADGSEKVNKAVNNSFAVITGGAQSLSRAQKDFDRLARAVDPLIAAQQTYQREIDRTIAVTNRFAAINNTVSKEVVDAIRQQGIAMAQTRLQQAVERTGTTVLPVHLQTPEMVAAFDAVQVNKAAAAADEFQAKLVAMRAQLDPLAAAQDKYNAEIAEFNRLSSQANGLSQAEMAQATAMAQQRLQQRVQQSGVTTLPEHLQTPEMVMAFDAVKANAAAASMEKLQAAAKALSAELDPVGARWANVTEKIAEYQRMLDAGFISTKQFDEAQTRLTTGAKSFEVMMQGAANGVRITQHQIANLGYQINDLAVGIVSGQSPFMIIMQQGLQIQQIFEGLTLKAALQTLGSGIVRFLTNPLTLAIVAAGALAVGITYLWRAWDSGAPKLEDSLKRQKELMTELKDLYGKSADAATRFFKAPESASVLRFQSRSTIAELQVSQQAEANTLLNNAGLMPGGRNPNYLPTVQNQPYGLLLDKFYKEMREGHPDFVVFSEGVAKVALSLDNVDATKAANELLKWAKAGKEAQQSTEELRRANLRMEQDLFGADHAGNARAIEARRQSNLMGRQFLLDITDADRMSPDQLADLARRQKQLEFDRMVPNAPTTPTLTKQAADVEQAGQTAYIKAQQDITRALRDRSEAMQRSIADAQHELDITGKSVGEVARLNAEYQLTAQAKEAAARAGVIVTPEELKRIKETADELGRLAQALAQTNLRRDIQFERSQIFRSDLDQQITDRLRSVYGDDLTSAAAQYDAQQLRINAHLQDMHDLGQDVSHTLFDGLKNGASAGELFLSVLSKIEDKLAGMIADNFGNALGAMFGGQPLTTGTGGGFNFNLGNLFTGILGRKVAETVQIEQGKVSPAPPSNWSYAKPSPWSYAPPSNGSRGATLPGFFPPEMNGVPYNARPAPAMGAALGGFMQMGAGMGGGSAAVSGVPFADLINAAASKYSIDPALLAGLIKAESSFNPNATGPWTRFGQAQGLTQLIPGTARQLGVTNPYDPRQSIFGGARYLDQQLDRFQDPSKALAAYNWGPGNVAKYGMGRLPAETQKYVEDVLANQQKFSQSVQKMTTSVANDTVQMSTGIGRVGEAAAQAGQSFPGQFGSGLQAVLQGIKGAAGGGGGGLANIFGSLFNTSFSGILGPMGLPHGYYAKGGIFDGGGVVNSPTLFPMARGMGLMGEAGPEAVMPLRRDRQGNLGVMWQAPPAANQNPAPVLNVSVVNNHPSARVSVQDNGPGRDPTIMVEETVANAVKGPKVQRELAANNGLRRAVVRR